MLLKEVLSKKFVNVEQVAEILQIGIDTKKNVFLYGRGGHAKSEIVQEFLKHVDPDGAESFVQACGEGLTEEKLFGGLNLEKFRKKGEIEHLVENSFMNYKYVVFEELLDSRMNVLLSLKDILTSGKFRQGTQQFNIRTEFVICITNRTKQEVSEDNSIKALLERFPLEVKVEWEKYDASDYSNMFSKVLGNGYVQVADICQAINESGDFVSPRTAIHMAEVYKVTKSISNLKYFGATSDIIAKMEKAEKERKQMEFIIRRRDDYTRIYERIDSNDINNCRTTLKELKELNNTLGAQTYGDKVYPEYAQLKKTIDEMINGVKNYVLNIVENGG